MPDQFGWDNNFGNNPAPTRHQLSKRQRELDASVSSEQAKEDVRREREALANRDKPHPQPDGFINDYD